MASNTSNVPYSSSPQTHSSPSRQTVTPVRNQATNPSVVITNLVAPTMVPPQATPPNTRSSRELKLMITLRREKVQDALSNAFCDYIMNELQQAFEAQCLLDHAGPVIADEVQLERRKIDCLKAGLYALRSIHTAWRKYPAVGGRLEGAPIGVIDFRFTAHSAVVEKPEGQLAAQYSRILADTVDPPQDESESAPRAQLRVNNCFLAIRKQFMKMFQQLAHEDLWSYICDDSVLSEDEAEPRSYSIQSTSAILHQPTTAAHLMSARGLAEAAEDEEDDNQHVYVTGKVLRNKADKYADLSSQAAKARRAEAGVAPRTRAQPTPVKADVRAIVAEDDESKAQRFRDHYIVSDSDDEEDDAIEAFARRAAARGAVSGRMKGGRKSTIDKDEEEDNMDDAAMVAQSATKWKSNARKRSALMAHDNDDDVDGENAMPAPIRRAKSTPAIKAPASSSSPTQPNSSNTSGGAQSNNSVAPQIAKRGGAAPKWLRDEDDVVHQLIVDHPDWPMPRVYREYSARVANTPYQRQGQATVEYRADFVEFPTGIVVGDKERRKYDIAWRTYESVRQHTEKFKASVSSSKTSPPYTWEPAQANLAAGMPERAPPPRPAFFNNVARTPVPTVPTVTADPATPPAATTFSPVQYQGPAGVFSAAPTSSRITRRHPQRARATASGAVAAALTRGRRSTGWNAINQSESSASPSIGLVDGDVAQAVNVMGDDKSAPGDDKVASLEDFVVQQSSPSSSCADEVQMADVVMEDE